jgi:hypothetical protein
MRKKSEKIAPLYQNGEIYDALDMQLVMLTLNKHGYDIHVSSVDARRLQVTCKKTNNRFLVECIGNNEWPETLLSVIPAAGSHS